MDINKNILFFPEREKGKADAKLRMRIRWGSDVVNFNVGHRIDPDKWSTDTQRCLKNTTNKKKVSAKLINSDIQKLHDRADDIFKVFETKNTVPTKNEFRNEFNARNGKVKAIVPDKDFWGYFDDFTAEMGMLNTWTDATFKKFESVKNHLQGFDENLTFAKISTDKLTAYVTYLRDVKGHRNVTIGKQLGFVRWYLRWAATKGFIDSKAFNDFRPKLKDVSKKRIIFLHWDELMTVYNKQLPDHKKYLDRVRDVFCFCCFTSLRYSDVANLKKSDVYKSHIEITTVKTGDTLQIELNNYSSALLKKYKDFTDHENRAFPVISNQRMNDYLKELGELCGLDRPITETYYKGNERFDSVQPLHTLLTSHVARRSFISNALMFNIPAEVVMEWTGHSDYKAMKPYIDIAKKAKKEGMDKFNQK